MSSLSIRGVAILATLLLGTTAGAAILVNPASPTTSDAITLRLENAFGADANAGSASITQTGNTFTIDQTVNIACTLPSNPTVASQFNVGLLPAGTYTVIANIHFVGSPPQTCPFPPVTQTSSFAVVPAEIPAIDPRLIALLAVVLLTVALLKLPSD